MKTRIRRAVIWCSLTLTGLVIPLWPVAVHACEVEHVAPIVPPEIIINEFVSHPLDGEKEWIELSLQSSEPVDLTDWVLEDAKGLIAKLTQTITPEDALLTITLESNKLNNNGDEIFLKNTNGEIITHTIYDNSPEQGASIAFNYETTTYVLTHTPTKNSPNQFDPIVEPEPAPETPSNASTSQSPSQAESEFLSGGEEPKTAPEIPIQPEPQAQAATEQERRLIITEVFPNPEGEDSGEFIELLNPTDTPISLAGWTMKDTSKTKFVFADEVIASHAHLVLGRAQTKIALNNSGTESVMLIHPSEEIIAAVTYIDSQEGMSFMFDANGLWKWSNTPTPGLPNTLTIPKSMTEKEIIEPTLQLVSTPIAEIASLPKGSLIRTSGLVSVVPGIIGSQFFYIAGSGIQVYMFSKDFPDLARGDVVEVTGEVTESRGEKRIKTSSRDDIVVLSDGTEPIAHEVLLKDITLDYTGWLVTVSGALTEKSKSHMYIDDGEAELKVDTRTLDNIVDAETGSTITVSGIIRTTKAGPVLFVRDAQDIVISEPEIIESEEEKIPLAMITDNESGFPWFKTGLIVTALAGLYFAYKKINLEKLIFSTKLKLQPIPVRNTDDTLFAEGIIDDEIRELVRIHKELEG